MNINYKIIMAVLLTAVVAVSCNQQNTKSTDAETSNSDFNELKDELQDVTREIDQLATKEGQEFKDGAESLVNKVNQKVEKFEAKAEDTGEEIDAKTRDALNKIKQSNQKIQSKLEKMGDETQDSWVDFKEEITHDFSEFGQSIKDFFKDNK